MSLLNPDKQQWLTDNQWTLEFNEPTIQKWIKVSEHTKHTLFIQHSADGKHYANLYHGFEPENSDDCKYFLLRNLKAMIKRYCEITEEEK